MAILFHIYVLDVLNKSIPVTKNHQKWIDETFLSINISFWSLLSGSNAIFSLILLGKVFSFQLFQHHKLCSFISDAPENIRLTSSKSGMGISHGDSVTIRCTAASNPEPRYTIYRNQTVLLNNSSSGVLTIASFSESDSGNYSCMAKNAVNSSTTDGVWFTYVKPIPTTSKCSCFIFAAFAFCLSLSTKWIKTRPSICKAASPWIYIVCPKKIVPCLCGYCRGALCSVTLVLHSWIGLASTST